jgi:hypothetical protein
MVYTSSPQAPARSSPLGGLTFSAKIAGNATPPTTLSCPIRGGAAVAAGQKVFCRFVVINANGEISSDTTTTVTTTA